MSPPLPVGPGRAVTREGGDQGELCPDKICEDPQDLWLLIQPLAGGKLAKGLLGF